MIYLILEVITIFLYMINGYLGFFSASVLFIYLWKYSKYTIENKVIISMILSIPFYNIGILGMDMHHIFSWFIISLIIYTIMLLVKLYRKEYILSKKCICLGISLIFLLIVNIVLKQDISSSFTDLLQILTMIVVILLTYCARNTFSKKIRKEDIYIWINKISITIIAIAICTILQCIVYEITQKKIGFITLFPQRTVYDLLFKGYSVLSIILGIGIIINITNIIQKREKIGVNIIGLTLCIIAVIINSSRTGLFSALLISICIIISNFIKKNKILRANRKQLWKCFAFFILIIFCAIIIFLLIQLSRENENIFSDNGRIITYENAIKTIFENPNNFFIGYGLSLINYNHIIPHNAILELILRLGVIFTVEVIGLFIYLLKYINNNTYTKYIVWHIIISSMFVAGFYEMTFMILYIAIAIIDTKISADKELNGKREIENE